MIGIIVPVHNEEQLLPGCLDALREAAADPALGGEPVLIVVVLDHCSDGSADVAMARGATVLTLGMRNVGAARAAGAEHALAHGARWLAFTDADTIVGATWLGAQLALASDAVCGTVAVDDWGVYGEPMREHFSRTYTDADGHRHIHGANLGVSAHAYRRVGGFLPLALGEDVALVGALLAEGLSVCFSAAPRVITSSRTDFRAAGGFGATLEAVAAMS
jgi:glycosyltransferase involved in cell wall biosynthesis